jgi:hypothetical protein
VYAGLQHHVSYGGSIGFRECPTLPVSVWPIIGRCARHVHVNCMHKQDGGMLSRLADVYICGLIIPSRDRFVLTGRAADASNDAVRERHCTMNRQATFFRSSPFGKIVSDSLHG